MAVAVPGLLMARAAVAEHRPLTVGVLLPETVLAAAMVYLATVLSLLERGRVSFPIAVRDGVILIIGTILVAIAFGQFAAPRLNPPKWNWISFAGSRSRAL